MKKITMDLNEIENRVYNAAESDLSIDVSAWSDELKARFDIIPQHETVITVDTFDVLSGREKASGEVSGLKELDMMATELLDRVDYLGCEYDEPDMFGLLAGCPIVLKTWEPVSSNGEKEVYHVCTQHIGDFSCYLSKIWSHGASEQGVFLDMAALGA